jgi:hypothetical protein
LATGDYLRLVAMETEAGVAVSILPGYRQDDRAIGFRSPAGAKDFSSNLCVQTGSGAHQASCTMVTGGPFPGAKRYWGVTLITHPLLVMSRSYISSPPSATIACSGTALLCHGNSFFQYHHRRFNVVVHYYYLYLYYLLFHFCIFQVDAL